MPQKSAFITVLTLAFCLLVKDIAPCILLNQDTIIYSETHQEKQSSEKSEKEGKKEMDESKIPFYLVSPIDPKVYLSSIHIAEDLKHSSFDSEVLSPPPKLA